MTMSELRERTSRFLQSLDQFTSRVGVTVAVAVGLAVFMVVNATFGFPSSWQGIFASASSVVVMVLLFALKHTQNRQQTALQLKLDEIIRALPGADNHLVQIERAEEQELGEREREQIMVHESLRNGSADADTTGN